MQILYNPINNFLSQSGKRLRPNICSLCAQIFGETEKHAYHAGLALEYFHNFTLIHDDIEDNSLLRRGQPCLHITHGIAQAINMGDTLFSLAIQVILDSIYTEQEKIFLLKLFNKNFLKVFEGQALELEWIHAKKWDLQEQDYINMIELKTGALIAVACKAGAYIGGASPEQQEILYKLGMSIGVGFQIQDDILNLIGQEKNYKKEIGEDITEGKRTLMILHVLNNQLINQEDKTQLKNILDSKTIDKKTIQWCTTLLTQSGSIDYAKQKSANIISKAIKELESHIPQNSAREELIKLVHGLITRET